MTLPGLVRANNLNDVVDRERAWDNLGSSLATGDIVIPTPSLDLNFAANKSLVDDISGDNLITFSRASTGTFVGSNGLIQTAASGVPRFDHNPVTGESLGLLVEEARTNLITRSQPSSALITNRTGTWASNGLWQQSYGSSVDRVLGNVTGVQFRPASVLGRAGYGTYYFLTADWAGIGHGSGDANERADVTSGRWSIFINPLDWTGDIRLGSIRGDGANQFSTSGGSVGYASGLIFNNGVYVGPESLVRAVLPDGTYWLHNIVWPQWSGGAWCRATFTTTVGDGIRGWWIGGFQYENNTSFSTSYIPTTGATATRAADVASITGANFSSWYRSDEGTFFVSGRQGNNDSNRPLLGLGAGTGAIAQGFGGTGGGRYASWWNGSFDLITSNSTTWSNGVKIGASYTFNNRRLCLNAGAVALSTTLLSNSGLVRIGANSNNTLTNVGTISRLTYWPSFLNDVSLQYITQPSITAINLYAFNYAINGKDVLALNAVRNASTRDFIFIKGLLSAAQPRLTAAAATTSSGLTLVANALPKLAPSSNGNYFFASGITLSGVTTRINGTNALSIATSPFSGSTATAPLLFSELRPQANWRITEPMPSGTIASPEFAIPFETNNFVLFMKAGQN